MLRWIALVLLVLPQIAAAQQHRMLDVSDQKRSYLIIAPAKPQGPAIVMLHGGGSKPAWAHWRTRDFGMPDWTIVYPAATGPRRWNDGRTGEDGAELGGTQDARFIVELIGVLTKSGLADPDKIFVVGVSNGGMMALRLLCEVPELFAGAAVVIGNQPIGLPCPTLASVPAVFFHGTADSVTPYAGGAVAKSGARLGNIAPADATVARYARRNRCADYNETLLPDPEPVDTTRVRRRVYRDCASALHHYIVDGGGHSWPGHPYQPKDEERFGPTTVDIDATSLIAEFFRQVTEK